MQKCMFLSESLFIFTLIGLNILTCWIILAPYWSASSNANKVIEIERTYKGMYKNLLAIHSKHFYILIINILLIKFYLNFKSVSQL